MQESPIKRMSTAELIRHTLDNLSDIIDNQVVLARLEIREGIASVFKGVGVLIAGIVSLFLMVAALMVAAILALSLVMPGWLAALLFAAIFLTVGSVLVFIGRAKLRIHPLKRTRETLTEDVEWAKRRLTSSTTSKA